MKSSLVGVAEKGSRALSVIAKNSLAVKSTWEPRGWTATILANLIQFQLVDDSVVIRPARTPNDREGRLGFLSASATISSAAPPDCLRCPESRPGNHADRSGASLARPCRRAARRRRWPRRAGLARSNK